MSKFNSKVYYGEYTLKHWIELILKEEVELPPYQRTFVWKEDKVKGLIKSLKNGVFVPPVIIGAYRENQETTRYYVLDGQQRLASVLLAYLGVYPDKEKFKQEKHDQIAESNNDDDEEENDLQDNYRLGWTFEKITDLKERDIEKIKLKLSKEYYAKLQYFEEDESIEEFFNEKTLSFSFVSLLEKTPDSINQKSFFANIFRSININSVPLSPMESREALYFLDEGKKPFLTPDCVKKLILNNRQLDFIRYLSMLSQYKKCNNTGYIAKGYGRNGMEKYYENYIYHIIDDTRYNDFASYQEIFTQSKMERLSKIINNGVFPKKFNSYIDADLWMFGLVWSILFENGNIENIVSKLSDIKNEIEDIERETNKKSRYNGIEATRERLCKSLAIYKKFNVESVSNDQR